MIRTVSKKNILVLFLMVCVLFAGFGASSASAQVHHKKKHRALKRVGIGAAIGAGAGGLIGGRKGALIGAGAGAGGGYLYHRHKQAQARKRYYRRHRRYRRS